MSGFLLLATVAVGVLFAVMVVHSSKINHRKEEAVPLDDFHLHMDKEGIDQEVQMFRLLVDESVEKINVQYEKIQKAQAELKDLLRQANDAAVRLRKLKKGITPEAGESKESQKPSSSDGPDFLNPNAGLENIAQQLNMGVGELKLRLTLLKKENLYYANRK